MDNVKLFLNFFMIFFSHSKEDTTMLQLTSFLSFVAAALLEVGGDALIRKGMRGSGIPLILLGCLVLSCYGVVVNLVRWDFSKLLGVYVAVFAVVSVLTGLFIFRETVPPSTWIGLAVIVCGGCIIQYGESIPRLF
jgi:drug/metabolite transporter superfamily protein YnfA